MHQVRDLEPKVLLVQPPFLDTALEAASLAGIPKDRVFQFSGEPTTPRNGVADWRAMLGSPSEGESYRWPQLSPHESRTTVATVNFSSGTTGLPKGVCVSHANLIANAEQSLFITYAETETPYVFAAEATTPFRPPPERYVGMLPLYHAFGQSWILFLALRLRHPVYVMPAFGYEAFLAVAARHRVTKLQVPPPVLTMLCKRPETAQYDLGSLRRVVAGAAPLSRELQNEVQRRFGVQVVQGWGMTEVTCGGLFVPGGVRDERGSVGVLLPGSEARIVGDDGETVVAAAAAGSNGGPMLRGELLIKGPQVCLGYWRNAAATEETLSADGWLRTGDVVEVDAAGWFWIVDRKKELIKVNALQVAPAELEKLLLEHENIADAGVVGITDGDGNEWPRAYCAVQQQPPSSANGKQAQQVAPRDIQAWVAARVAKHKQLVGGVVFVDDVPRLPSGKIQRKVLKEWAKRDARLLEAGDIGRARI